MGLQRVRCQGPAGLVRRGHLARAVRDAVSAALARTAPGAQVTVTVTGAV
ncbi:hypothetical protein ACFUAC_06155 [Streptomyces sp. NPDC057148]